MGLVVFLIEPAQLHAVGSFITEEAKFQTWNPTIKIKTEDPGGLKNFVGIDGDDSPVPLDPN